MGVPGVLSQRGRPHGGGNGCKIELEILWFFGFWLERKVDFVALLITRSVCQFDSYSVNLARYTLISKNLFSKLFLLRFLQNRVNFTSVSVIFYLNSR